MMGAIDEVKRELASYPDIAYKVEGSYIVIAATDATGFNVCLLEGESETIVFCDGWHEHFESIRDAVGCFVWSLTTNCRLRVVRYGKRPYRWTLQSLRDGEWVSHSTTALLYPFWRKRELVYLQNAHMTPIWAAQGQRDETARH